MLEPLRGDSLPLWMMKSEIVNKSDDDDNNNDDDDDDDGDDNYDDDDDDDNDDDNDDNYDDDAKAAGEPKSRRKRRSPSGGTLQTESKIISPKYFSRNFPPIICPKSQPAASPVLRSLLVHSGFLE